MAVVLKTCISCSPMLYEMRQPPFVVSRPVCFVTKSPSEVLVLICSDSIIRIRQAWFFKMAQRSYLDFGRSVRIPLFSMVVLIMACGSANFESALN